MHASCFARARVSRVGKTRARKFQQKLNTPRGRFKFLLGVYYTLLSKARRMTLVVRLSVFEGVYRLFVSPNISSYHAWESGITYCRSHRRRTRIFSIATRSFHRVSRRASRILACCLFFLQLSGKVRACLSLFPYFDTFFFLFPKVSCARKSFRASTSSRCLCYLAKVYKSIDPLRSTTYIRLTREIVMFLVCASIFPQIYVLHVTII